MNYHGEEITTNPENKLVKLIWRRKLNKPIKDLDMGMPTEHGLAKKFQNIPVPAQAFQ